MQRHVSQTSMFRNVSSHPRRSRRELALEVIHRNAVDAALRKAAVLDRVDPRGDPYGAAGQALEDYFRRHDQIVAAREDVSGWISTVTERRWISELRYQARRGFERLDAPAGAQTKTTLVELIEDRGLAVEDVIEARERLHATAAEQREALAHLRAHGVQERHVRIVELALTTELSHDEIAIRVNAEFERSKDIRANTVTQIISRQRNGLAAAEGFSTVVARLRRTRQRAPEQ